MNTKPIPQDLAEAIDQLSYIAYGNSKGHGFWDDYLRVSHLLSEHGIAKDALKYEIDTKLSKIALMHSELGEMTEGVRKPHPDEHCPEFTSEEIELADALIRAFDYAGAFNLRLGAAILAKMAYNESRPYMHGKGA